MFWNRKPKEQPASIETCAHAWYEALANALTQNRGIHVEDFISAAGAVVGEICIETAGDFNPRDHQFVPGQRVFSTKVNDLFSGDKDIDAAPANSVVGIVRDRLLNSGFTRTDFPPTLNSIFQHFAANVGKPEDWGKALLSVSKEHHPFVIPLRAAYEMRPTVEKVFTPLGNNSPQRLRAATLTLAEVLCKTRDALDRRIAVLLALETVNSMAKTAPMTAAAMAKQQAEKKS